MLPNTGPDPERIGARLVELGEKGEQRNRAKEAMAGHDFNMVTSSRIPDHFIAVWSQENAPQDG
jgi:hypothetical protein